MPCANCSDGMLGLLRADISAAAMRTPRALLGIAVLDPLGLVLLYRLAHRLYFGPLRPLSWVLKAISTVVYSADIHPAACLGPRLRFAHYIGVVIGSGVLAGSDLSVFAHVTLGQDENGQFPILGSHVTVFTGACVIGAALLHDGCRVAANSFVDIDVPPGELAAGVPARVIPRRT